METSRQRGRDIGTPSKQTAARIRELRELAPMTLQELAERIALGEHALDVSALSKIETGKRRIDVDDLVAIAGALGVKVSDLVPEPLRPIQSDGGRAKKEHDRVMALPAKERDEVLAEWRRDAERDELRGLIQTITADLARLRASI